MNMESMRVRSYRSIAADEHVPEEAAERYRTLKAYEKLRAAKVQRGRRAGPTRDQPQDAVPVAVRAGRERPARTGAEADPSAPCPSTGVQAQGRQGGDGRAPQVPVHGQGAHPRHAGAQGGTPERVDGRPDHRTRPGGRRDPPRIVLRGTRQAQAAAQLPEGAACAALATRWKYGSKARRPGELVQRALARIDPHDLHRWRADAEGVREP